MEFCPVCMLRKAASGAESGESSASEDTVKSTTSEQASQRFEHYQLVTGEDGKPVELGRDAMGVTYKAFDINLRCPVTLKVFRLFTKETVAGTREVLLEYFKEGALQPTIAKVFPLIRGSRGGPLFDRRSPPMGECLWRSLTRAGIRSFHRDRPFSPCT